MILKGKVIIFRIGFTKEFRNPKNSPAKSRVPRKLSKITPGPGSRKNGPLNLTPGTNLVASQRLRIPAIVLRINFHTL